MKQVVLLRGVNVGGRNKLPMAALRDALAAAGMREVSTYLQSGNVVLASDASEQELARACERTIATVFDLELSVVVRTHDELADVVSRNPLAGVAVEPKLYQVSFCAAEPDAAAIDALAEQAVEGEQLLADGREVYAWFPHGVARSKLAARLSARGLGVPTTARNWTTVTKLLELAGG